MTRPNVTRVSNLQISPVPSNKNNGFYAPQLTTAQINAIPATTLVNGAIVYNTTTNLFQLYQNGVWSNLTVTRITTVAANYTVLNTDTIIGVNSGAARTITLPAIATAIVGKIFTIKDVTGGGGANNITIAADANIDGGAAGAQTIAVNYGFINVFSNGTQWFILSKLIA